MKTNDEAEEVEEAEKIVEIDCNMSYFSKCLGKLEDSHIYKLEYNNGKLNVVCHPCSAAKKKNKYMEAGSQEKAFSNLKAHVKSKSHTQNSMSFKGVDIRNDAMKKQHTQEI